MLDLDKIKENTAKGVGMNDAIRLEELRTMTGIRILPAATPDPFVDVDPNAETKEMPVLHSDKPKFKKDA